MENAMIHACVSSRITRVDKFRLAKEGHVPQKSTGM
jgi:hypothetical protein